MVLLECTDGEDFGEFKDKYKRGFPMSTYIALSLTYRMSVGFYVGLEHDYEEGTFIVVGFSMLWLLYNLANLPYRQAYHNYRAGIMHLTHFLILMVSNYYRSMRSTTALRYKSKIYSPSILILACLGLCVTVSLVVLAYDVVTYVRKWVRCMMPAL